MQNNIRGHTRRSAASAFQIGASGIGGIFASLVFRGQDAPKYVPGLAAAIACEAAAIVSSLGLACYFYWRNRRQDKGLDSEPIEGVSFPRTRLLLGSCS